jgi:hypothetical protein
MSLLHATGKVLLIIFIIYTVFNSIFVVQTQLAGAAQHRACNAHLADHPSEPSTSPNRLSDCEWDASDSAERK